MVMIRGEARYPISLGMKNFDRSMKKLSKVPGLIPAVFPEDSVSKQFTTADFFNARFNILDFFDRQLNPRSF